MQYCFDCDSYNCRCWLEEDQDYVNSLNYIKENLFDLMKDMQVTKEEIARLIDLIQAGRLNGLHTLSNTPIGPCGCLIGLTAYIRNEYDIEYKPNQEYMSKMLHINRMRPYGLIEEFVQDDDNSVIVVSWLREML